MTLLVEIDHQDRPDWVWSSHADNLIMHKVRVLAIGEGDQMQDLQEGNEGSDE